MAARPRFRAAISTLLAAAWVVSAAAPMCRGESCGKAVEPAEDCCSGHVCCEAASTGCAPVSQAGSPHDCCGALSSSDATAPVKAPPLPALALATRAALADPPASAPSTLLGLARDPAPPPDDGLYTLHSSFLI